MSPAEAASAFAMLHAHLDWRQPQLEIFGRTVPAPRLEAWHGDAGARYRYSGLDHDPAPWTPLLADLRDRVQAATNAQYNSVLANLYRNGQDSNGWHADDERELGEQPAIASLSLGATRRFLLRHRESGEQIELSLEEGSLLFMGGRTQQCWKHTVPKERRVSGARINLTFRYIFVR